MKFLNGKTPPQAAIPPVSIPTLMPDSTICLRKIEKVTLGKNILGRLVQSERGQLRNFTLLADAVFPPVTSGGEEFLFMLPETSMEGVKIFAEKIRHKIESHVFEYNDHKIHISLTIGVSLYEPSENPEISDCITKADKALYRGKAEGKNRIVS